MTTALALPSLLPGTIHDQGIVLPPDLSFDAWEQSLRTGEWLEQASPWIVVDLVGYGDSKFGEDASQAWPTFEEDPEGSRQARLKQALWMASVWPPGTRVPGQSYTAHRVVAKLARVDAVGLLSERDTDGKRLSTRELARRADEIEAAIALDSTVVATCAADAPWQPSVSDLEPEWRERALAGPSSFTDGYIRALIDTGTEVAFIPGRWRE